jgi:hypothetical protein
MTLTEFRYIVALARERHFGRAAEKCNVSQPTLSVAVKKLEEELGVALFERNSGDVRPTPMWCPRRSARWPKRRAWPKSPPPARIRSPAPCASA